MSAHVTLRREKPRKRRPPTHLSPLARTGSVSLGLVERLCSLLSDLHAPSDEEGVHLERGAVRAVLGVVGRVGVGGADDIEEGREACGVCRGVFVSVLRYEYLWRSSQRGQVGRDGLEVRASKSLERVGPVSESADLGSRGSVRSSEA